jgi:hypothetical protein
MELQDSPRVRGRHFDDGLVGLDLGQGLVGLDLVALLDQPADDLAFGDALSDVRETELLGHVSTP